MVDARRVGRCDMFAYLGSGDIYVKYATSFTISIECRYVSRGNDKSRGDEKDETAATRSYRYIARGKFGTRINIPDDGIRIGCGST